MGPVLRFIAWLFTQIWRYGKRTIDRVVAWVRSHWSTVQRWVERGVTWGTILQWILDILGIG